MPSAQLKMICSVFGLDAEAVELQVKALQSVDVAALIAQANGVVQGIPAAITGIRQSLDRIETKQDLILEHLKGTPHASAQDTLQLDTPLLAGRTGDGDGESGGPAGSGNAH